MLDVLRAAGYDVPDQERYAPHFPPDLDLEAMEEAQRAYGELLDIRGRTMTFDVRLRVKPAFAKPRDYALAISAAERHALALIDQFGPGLMATPTLKAQRQFPN